MFNYSRVLVSYSCGQSIPLTNQQIKTNSKHCIYRSYFGKTRKEIRGQNYVFDKYLMLMRERLEIRGLALENNTLQFLYGTGSRVGMLGFKFQPKHPVSINLGARPFTSLCPHPLVCNMGYCQDPPHSSVVETNLGLGKSLVHGKCSISLTTLSLAWSLQRGCM